MKVNVAQVRFRKGESVRFELLEETPSFEWETESLSFQAPIHVQLQVNNTDKAMLVQGNIQTELKATCARCLETYIYPISFSFQDEWVFRTQATEEQLETALLLDQDEVDITERIYEQIVLVLPMKFICSAECQGLCPICGANRNLTACHCVKDDINPWFAALSNLQSSDN
ncbi:MAG: YceD family protein [Desulfosporosinus sp.]